MVKADPFATAAENKVIRYLDDNKCNLLTNMRHLSAGEPT
jgi:hypothetical protein